jgi:signal transduction histidine kinase
MVLIAGRRWVLALVLTLLSLASYSHIDDVNLIHLLSGESVNVLDKSQLLEDAESTFTWQEALNSSEWNDVQTSSLNLGITGSSYWFKASIHYGEDQTRIFQINYPLLDYVSFYLVKHNHNATSVNYSIIKEVQTGDALEFESRQINDKNFVFSHYAKKGTSLTVLIRVKTQGTMVMPLSTTDIEYYADENSIESVAYGIYFGITFAMLIYNLMLFIYLKEQSYLYYCLFVFTIFVSAISYTGHGFQWLWPDAQDLNLFMAPLSAAVGFLFSVLFMSSFLRIRQRDVWGERVFHVGVSLSVLVIASAVFLTYSTSLKVISVVQVILTIVIMSYSISLWRKGIVEAKYFTIAWMSFIIGNAISAMRVIGVAPSNEFTVYANLYGNVIEMLMLSMGLAYRFETMRKTQISLSRELRLSQQEAIGNLEKFRDLFQKSPVGLFRYDRENNVFFNNTKATELIGGHEDIDEFLRSNLTFGDYKYLLRNNILKDRVINFQEEVFYSLTLLVVRNTQGKVVEVEGTLSDISSQKQAEKNSITNEKEKLNSLTQLVVGISHQFNTPLGVLITTGDLVKNNLSQVLDEIDNGRLKKDELLQTLYMIQDAMDLSTENTKVMSAILKNLRYSISTRKDLNLSDILLNGLFTDLYGYYKAQLKEDGRRCNFELSVNTNNIESIVCDYDVISDVILRLYENSNSHAYYGRENGGCVFINLKENESYVIIEYVDDGRGLNEMERGNIFVPFFTGNSRAKENSGLGMFILHNQIVKILQGKIELLSPEKGFGISIQIPKVYTDTIEFSI